MIRARGFVFIVYSLTRLSLCMKRQCHAKSTPLTNFALNINSAIHGNHQLLNDSQPQPNPPKSSPYSFIGLAKRLKNKSPVFLRDANASILDLHDPAFSAILVDMNLNTARLGIFYGIDNEV